MDWYDAKIDLFFPDGKPNRKSRSGSLLTCCIIFILLAYLGQSIFAMVTRRAFQVSSYQVEAGNDPAQPLTARDGLQLVVGLYTSGSNSQAFDPLDYIELNVRLSGSPKPGDENRSLQQTRCSNQDIGLGKGATESKISPVSDIKIGKLNALNINWYCFDLSDYEVYGNWETEFYSMLSIGFSIRSELCTDSSAIECIASSQTERQLSRIRTVLLVNHGRFDPDDFETPIVQETMPIYTEIPARAFRIQYQFERGTLERDDDFYRKVAGYTSIQDNYYSLKEAGYGTRTFNYQTRLLYTFTMSPNLSVNTRSIQSIVSLVATLGGIATVFTAMGAPIARCLTFQNAHNSLIGFLYKTGPFQEDIHPDASHQSTCKEWIQQRLCLCCCFKRDNRDRFYIKARNRLTQELDLIYMLRQLRLFNLFINQQLKPQAVRELKKQAQKEIILLENYRAYEINEVTNEFAYRPRERRITGANLEHISDLESSIEQPSQQAQLQNSKQQTPGSQRSFIVPPDEQKPPRKKLSKRVVRDVQILPT